MSLYIVLKKDDIVLNTNHATAVGEKRRPCRKRLAFSPDAEELAGELQAKADTAREEAEALKSAAGLEDLHLWEMKWVKTAKKGSKTYSAWMATWREGGKVRNAYLGSCRRLSREEALEKAMQLKAQALETRRLCSPAARLYP